MSGEIEAPAKASPETNNQIRRSLNFWLGRYTDIYGYYERTLDFSTYPPTKSPHDIIVGKIETECKKYAESYLSWELVRHHRGLSVTNNHVPQTTYEGIRYRGLTGFEGYFAGMGLGHEEIFEKVSKMGEAIYADYNRSHRISRRDFLQKIDPKHTPSGLYIDDLTETFRMQLACSRSLIFQPPSEGKVYNRLTHNEFRSTTKTNVSTATIEYTYVPSPSPSLSQEIEFKSDQSPVSTITYEIPQVDAFGYAVMSQIGILGHPIYRLYERLKPELY